jgi:HEAT repeat protein/beta-lactamase regulating signal transducer with metallopeptidase domain
MTAVQVVGWALVHFLWQGTLVAAGLAVALTVTGKRSPTVRYGVSLMALIVMAALPLATGARLLRMPPATLAEGGQIPGIADVNLNVTPGVGGPASERSPGESGPPTAAAGRANSSRLGDGLDLAIREVLDRAMPWVVGIWVGGVMLLALRLLGGWAWARRLTQVGTRPASQALKAALRRLQTAMRVRGRVRLLESVMVQVPAVVGWLRPVLLVPVSAATGLSTEQLEVLLAHELAHIRRHDYAVNLLQSVVETLLFYHPAVWWVSRRIRQEREDCCDDIAVAVCADPRAYAAALLELENLRLPDLGLAAAASGGSLVHRITRLVKPEGSHADGGRQWVAGAIAVGAVVALAGSSGFSRAAVLSGAVMDRPGEEVAASDQKPQWSVPAAEPDTVIMDSGEGTLEERWSRAIALARAEAFGGFWIGYAIGGDADRFGWFYLDRHSPIRTADGSTLSGHLRFRGEPDGLVFGGLPLDRLVGDRAPDDVALLLGYVVRDGRTVLDRVHAGNVVFPVRFDRRAVLWLGGAEDAASITLLRRLHGEASSAEVRDDLVAMVGTHTDSPTVVPVLIRWLQEGDSDDTRSQAAEWLSLHPDPAALAALARAARGDRAADVRAEAAEAVGDMDLSAAADTLVRLAGTLTDRRARAEAVEALGARSEDQALDALVRIARDDPSADIQTEAVETLGDLKDQRGVPALVDILGSHPRSAARSEALETLAEAAEAAQALTVLSQTAQRDPDPEVQRAAVEALGQLEDPAARGLLVDLARSHPRPEVRQEAVETLHEAAPPDEAFDLLQRMAREDPDAEVQREAVETLGEVQQHAVEMGLMGTADAVLETLREIAGGHARAEIMVEAVETIGELHDPRVVDILADLAERHPRPEVQMEAVATLGQAAEPVDAARVLDRLINGRSPVEVQVEAVETLGELHDHVPGILDRLLGIAGSHGSSEVRMEAVETFGEHAEGEAAASRLAELVRTAPSREVQMEALEALGQMHDGAGIPAIIEIARSHPDREVRLEAIQQLGQSDDPRAVRVLEGLIRR